MRTKGLILKPNAVQRTETLNKVFNEHVNELADYGPNSKYTKMRKTHLFLTTDDSSAAKVNDIPMDDAYITEGKHSTRNPAKRVFSSTAKCDKMRKMNNTALSMRSCKESRVLTPSV